MSDLSKFLAAIWPLIVQFVRDILNLDKVAAGAVIGLDAIRNALKMAFGVAATVAKFTASLVDDLLIEAATHLVSDDELWAILTKLADLKTGLMASPEKVGQTAALEAQLTDALQAKVAGLDWSALIALIQAIIAFINSFKPTPPVPPAPPVPPIVIT